MPADASPAATDRPEPPGRVDVERRETAVTVPPPRSAPAVEAAPTAPTTGATPGPGDRAGEAEDRTAAPADGPSAEVGPADGLTERERRILAFEQQWWKHAGAKEQAIRDTFGLSATRYYQLLNALLDQPAALAAEPVLVARLRRLRASRARNRRR
ncbi:DUF3263 domain-containing protein [Micromonospora globispora]|uniref:DUF3263 domain-containing protein n=2 Tax=Micromonospora globispora TaxID=1450148 RepID=A0A317K177_9ACTN|nr:DUF3263 domain-containing protein [Micromonospora globispora]PWU46094.1 DUF3263 domain-containing protein [Micromonospora globispora]PWU61665.1 DUF3263 domain-containing protein [Micromonospora globispora]